MKLNNTPHHLAVTSDNVTTSEFSIRNSAKAFSILSSGLYTNKIRAIVRELSCNAVDAQIEAGNRNAKFDIHLPNDLEPFFSIRDYGTGLDHEGVTKLYSTYFESTKTESNDYIGALGLGSKSPFSYTDNFTVTAIKDGVKGIYTAFINDSGVPSIATLSQSETDEPAGLEIHINVERGDFREFQYEAQHVYRYFKQRPRILNCKDFEFEDIDYERKDIVRGIHIRKDGAYRSESRARAIMGNIAYPIKLEGGVIHETLEHLANRCHLDIEFDLGDIEFAANREALSLTPATIKMIEYRLREVAKHVLIQVEKEVRAETNFWKQLEVIRELKTINLYSHVVEDFVKRNSEFQEYFSEFKTEDLANRYNIEIKGLSPDSWNNSVRKMEPDRNYQDNYLYWRMQGGKNVVFVEQVGKRGIYKRARDHFAEYDRRRATSSVYLLMPHDADKPMKVQEFYGDMKDPLCTMLSTELDEPVRKASTKQTPICRYLVMSTASYTTKWVWESKPIDLMSQDDTHVWATLEDGAMTEIQGKSRNFKNIADMMYRAGIHSSQVKFCALAKSRVDLIKGKKNWIHVDEFIKQKLAEWTSRPTLLAMAASETNMPQLGKLVDELTEGLMYENREILGIKRETSYYEIVKVLRNFRKHECYEETVKECQAVIQAVEAQYPMLSLVDTSSRNAKILVDYIKMVDSATTTGEE